jgi:arabinogalactan oligomer/maltooligosaccharide transport system permease protein
MLKPRRREQILMQLALALVGLWVALPLWSLVQMAFDGAIRGWPIHFRLWPEQPTLATFAEVWVHPAQILAFSGLLANSLAVAGGAAVLATVLGASMAYAFARFRFPGRRAGLFALLTGALLPPVALMTPLFILLTALQVRAQYPLLALTIVYTAFAMPFCVWNMRAAFQAVPAELEEAAFLDGATNFDAFRHVTLPLALPSIGVAALVAFLAGYSEFAMAWLFVDKADNVTLAMALAGMFGQIGASWNLMAALALMMSVPVVLLFVVLQRYLLSGLLVGAAE